MTEFHEDYIDQLHEEESKMKYFNWKPWAYAVVAVFLGMLLYSFAANAQNCIKPEDVIEGLKSKGYEDVYVFYDATDDIVATYNRHHSKDLKDIIALKSEKNPLIGVFFYDKNMCLVNGVDMTIEQFEGGLNFYKSLQPQAKYLGMVNMKGVFDNGS